MRQTQKREVFAPDGKAVPSSTSINLLETSLTLKSGDRTVVGVSKLNGGDNALILIFTAK